MTKSLSFWLVLSRVVTLFLLIVVLASSFYAVSPTPAHPILFKEVPQNNVSSVSSEIPALEVPTGEISPTIAPKTAPPVSIGDEYLALGDSVAYGVGAPVPDKQGYAGDFYASYLHQVQPRLAVYKDFGVPGETSASFIEKAHGQSQLQRALAEIDAAKAANHRISPITLTIGGNDMLDARNLSDAGKNEVLAKYDANLQKILDALKARTGGQSDIIVTTYFNPFGNVAGQDTDVAWIQRFNNLIKQRSQERSLKVADFYPAIVGNELNLTWISYGDVHPNQTGYTRLAQVVWQASGYDRVPPTLSLVYSGLPQDGKVVAGQRFVFKLNVQDNWSVTTAEAYSPGAGKIWEATLTVDDNPRHSLAIVPASFVTVAAGSQQFSYLLDTTGLNVGSHLVVFTATDAAGNVQKLDVNFEVVG